MWNRNGGGIHLLTYQLRMTRTTIGTGYVVRAMVVTKWTIRSYFKDVLASQDICKSFSQLLLNEVHFALSTGSQNVETLMFATKKGFILKAAKQEDGRKDLKSTSQKARGTGYL